MTLATNSFIITTLDEQRLFVNIFDSENFKSDKQNNPKKVLFILHGYGEHSGRYNHFSHYLKNEYDRFYAMDLRGHGRSSGLRGHTPSFQTLIDDIYLVIQEVVKREPNASFAFCCHSFGGLLGLALLFQAYQRSDRKLPFQYAIVSAPQLEIAVKVPKILSGIASILDKSLYKLQLTSNIDYRDLSHDPANNLAYRQDKLVHAKITPRMFFSMQEGMQWVRSQHGDLPCPLLLIVPGKDKIVSAEAERIFYRQLNFSKKDIIEYPEYFHESFNELEKSKVFDDIKKWVQKQ